MKSGEEEQESIPVQKDASQEGREYEREPELEGRDYGALLKRTKTVRVVQECYREKAGGIHHKVQRDDPGYMLVHDALSKRE